VLARTRVDKPRAICFENIRRKVCRRAGSERNSGGNPNVSTWLGTGAGGAGFRGCGWNNFSTDARLASARRKQLRIVATITAAAASAPRRNPDCAKHPLCISRTPTVPCVGDGLTVGSPRLRGAPIDWKGTKAPEFSRCSLPVRESHLTHMPGHVEEGWCRTRCSFAPTVAHLLLVSSCPFG
jgi:hypothetical protein